MANFFPTNTLAFRIDEARPFRRVTFSVVEMAVITAVVLRVYRALALSIAGANLTLLGISFAIGFVVLFGMVTLHLGNFTVRRWTWRAPLFATIEASVEALVSLGLIALGREPLGSARATFQDWPGIALTIFSWRIGSILLFTLLLAGVIQLARMTLGEEAADAGREPGETLA
ncbi:MAG TPA: hypothetical protein VF981_07200 [Gemmatimonadaceae bacterium]